MIFSRHIAHNLLEWKRSSNRKPLLIRGARQVGKTTVVKEFAKSYRNSILLNLEKTKDKNVFETNEDVKTVVEYLFLLNNISLKDIDNTLLFIDEIQEVPTAIQLLRYFYEEFPKMHIIAAGSLLEFALKEVKSFPVGRVNYLYLYPLNFSEFLLAINNDMALEQLNNVPVKDFAHNVLLELFNKFAIIGGMPEVVSEFVEKDSIIDLPKIYEHIWQTYKEDVEKYSSNTTDRNVIRHIMSVVHTYIDQRIKFQNFGNSNYKSREVGEAMRNLDRALILKLIYPTTDIEPPLRPDYRKSPKVQLLDTGIVNYSLGIQADMLSVKDFSNTFKGAIIPHIITQELISLNSEFTKDTHFWVREKTQSSSEVDLVYTYDGKIIPIEIKSGATGSLKSLHQFIDRASHNYAVRIYGGKFIIENSITPSGKPYVLMNMPYYLGVKIPEYIAYFIDNH